MSSLLARPCERRATEGAALRPAAWRLRAGALAMAFALAGTAPALHAADQTAPQTGTSSTTLAPAPQPVTTVAELSSLPAPNIAARAWISVDATTGQVIAATDPDIRVEPASLTKVMTAYLVFKALDEKRLTLEQQVPVSEHAWRTGGSRMFIEPRKPVTVGELIQGMIVQSGNDASVALAEAVAGSESAFAALMNQEAERLGMTGTHFTNSTGLPDADHYTTVRDLSVLASHIAQDYPTQYEYYRQREYTYNNITQPNRNRLLWLDPTVDGMKTGHTEAAGYCLIASALRGDRRVVTVVVGTASETVRAQESLKLLNWSFQNFDSVQLYAANQPAVEARVWKGAADQAKLGATNPIRVTVPRGQAAQLQPVVERTDPLVAPLEQGQPVGTLKLVLNGRVLSQTPLTVLEPVAEASFFGRMFDAIRMRFE
ncbi:D-alanyl-D-alanine carboxypeptidase family protein [Verticiella sediminum]|nr:D-alanyl-D-alanine carboxypeptidase family protein [Verticiella sediminum]